MILTPTGSPTGIFLCRSRKRKLLPGKQADEATAEALCGELDPEALPLRALATPIAMRTRRARC